MRLIYVCILSAISFSLGYLISRLIQIPKVSVKTEIDPVGLISIFTTISIAIIFTIFIDRNKEREKVKIGLIYKRIDDIYKISSDYNEKISNLTINNQIVVYNIKKIRITLRTLFDILSIKNINTDIKYSDVDDIIKEINILSTSTPKNYLIDKHISYKDGNYCYSDKRASEIGSKIESFKNILFRLQIQINDY